MQYIYLTILLSSLLTICTSANADNAINVVHEGAVTDYGIDDAISLLNDLLDIDQPITLRLGANDGPLFDPSINEIWIPDEFVTDIESRFSKAGLTEDDEHANEIVQDVLIHTLFHEIGHALIAQYDLPVLGKEEDAVDALANVLILESYEQGAEVTLNAADMFGLESEDRDNFDEQDFWDSHSLDIQRYYSTLCHVYGFAPEYHEFFIEDELLSEDRADECIDEYQQLAQSWFALLDPYLAEED